MHIDIITLFPTMFDSLTTVSILKRALDRGLFSLNIHDLRQWTKGIHKQADDRPFGGGPGMVMMVEPIHKAVTSLKKQSGSQVVRTILMSAKGSRYSQEKAYSLSKLDHLILICGHYEGVDERVALHIADEEISIGDFVLTGGEIPAMTITDSVVRLIPGVLGDDNSIIEESHSQPGYLEYPQYTRPENYNGWTVPSVLLSGNHSQIQSWRHDQTSLVKPKRGFNK